MQYVWMHSNAKNTKRTINSRDLKTNVVCCCSMFLFPFFKNQNWKAVGENKLELESHGRECLIRRFPGTRAKLPSHTKFGDSSSFMLRDMLKIQDSISFFFLSISRKGGNLSMIVISKHVALLGFEIIRMNRQSDITSSNWLFMPFIYIIYYLGSDKCPSACETYLYISIIPFLASFKGFMI